MGTQNDPPLMPSEVNVSGEPPRVVSSDAASAATPQDEEKSTSQVLNLLGELRPKIEAFCRERPLTAIGLGVAAGVLLRQLVSRR